VFYLLPGNGAARAVGTAVVPNAVAVPRLLNDPAKGVEHLVGDRHLWRVSKGKIFGRDNAASFEGAVAELQADPARHIFDCGVDVAGPTEVVRKELGEGVTLEPEPLCALLTECGVTNPTAIAQPGWHPLWEPEDWWTIILGSGYRSTVEALSAGNRERVRAASVAGVREADVRQIRADVALCHGAAANA
jgi:hypothetical protein